MINNAQLSEQNHFTHAHFHTNTHTTRYLTVPMTQTHLADRQILEPPKKPPMFLRVSNTEIAPIHCISSQHTVCVKSLNSVKFWIVS